MSQLHAANNGTREGTDRSRENTEQGGFLPRDNREIAKLGTRPRNKDDAEKKKKKEKGRKINPQECKSVHSPILRAKTYSASLCFPDPLKLSL
jgi:hypothetical protein